MRAVLRLAANSLLSRIAFAQTAPKTKNVAPTTAGVTAMNAPTYDKSISALLVVDPYNDFISEGVPQWFHLLAKLWIEMTEQHAEHDRDRQGARPYGAADHANDGQRGD